LFYFTHPGRAGTIKPGDKPATELRTQLHPGCRIVEKDGVLSLRPRRADTHIRLVPAPW